MFTFPLLVTMCTLPWPNQSQIIVPYGQALTIASLQMSLAPADEFTQQILSYGLLFLIFYCFPYTAGPPTSTAPTRPSPTFA